MISKKLEGISTFPLTGPRPFDDYMHVNFERELNLAVQAASSVPRSETCVSILSFGYQGNGKNAFVRRVSQAMFERGYSTAWLDFEVLRLQTREMLMDVSKRLSTHLSTGPCLLVASGLDVMATAVTDPKDYLAQLSSTVVECAARQSPPGLMIAATAEVPALALPLLPRPTKLVYFDWPDEKIAAEIFRLLKLPYGDEVATRVLTEARERGVRYTTRSLIMGAREARRIASTVDKLASISLNETVELIAAMCSPTPEDEAITYEMDQEAHIRGAMETTELDTTTQKEGRLEEENGLRS